MAEKQEQMDCDHEWEKKTETQGFFMSTKVVCSKCGVSRETLEFREMMEQVLNREQAQASRLRTARRCASEGEYGRAIEAVVGFLAVEHGYELDTETEDDLI